METCFSFRSGKEAGLEDGVGVKGTMKDAVGKSFDKSKETVQESAKSAADLVGGAIHKTAEKVKGTKSASERESDAEL